MSASDERLIVAFEIEIDGEVNHMEIGEISVIPNVGDEVEFNYVHGQKVRFKVTGVKHQISSIGHNLLQQVTVLGRAI